VLSVRTRFLPNIYIFRYLRYHYGTSGQKKKTDLNQAKVSWCNCSSEKYNGPWIYQKFRLVDFNWSVEKLERAAFGLNFSDEKKRRRKKTSKILYTSQLIIGIFSDTTLLLPIIIQRYIYVLFSFFFIKHYVASVTGWCFFSGASRTNTILASSFIFRIEPRFSSTWL